jgi:hypothetical protein
MRRCNTHPTPLIAGLLTGLLLAILVVPLNAQPTEPHHQVFYDISKEVTFSARVESVITRAPHGMMLGSHLMLETASGKMDASLGKWGLEGKGALTVEAGQQIEVTGVLKTLKDRQVFIVRTVKSGGQTFSIRNRHGLPISPMGRELLQKNAEKGASL